MTAMCTNVSSAMLELSMRSMKTWLIGHDGELWHASILYFVRYFIFSLLKFLYTDGRSWRTPRFFVPTKCVVAACQLRFRKQFKHGIIRNGIFPPIGGFPPIERSHGSFLRSVQIRWENYRVYLTCERFSESNFANLPHALISFLHGTFSNGVNLFCFGHHHSVHGLAESTTKGSNPIVTCKSAVYGL